MLLTAACVLTLLGPGAELALAGEPDDNPATDTLPRGLPYEGHLAIDGVPLNRPTAVRFALWSLPVGGVLLFDESQDVVFVNGRFSVLLGVGDARIPPIVFDAADVYLGVTVRNTELSGRQRIVPVPHALWAARAADFTVAGRLTVRGVLDAEAAQVGGLSAGDATIGTLSSGSLNLPSAGGIQGVTGFRVSAAISVSSNHPRRQVDTGVNISNGMCFISTAWTQNVGFACKVYIGPNGQWFVSAFGPMLFCEARCLILK